MITDPLLLSRLATANMEIASAMEELASDDDDRFAQIHGKLSEIGYLIEALIIDEVNWKPAPPPVLT